MNKIYTFEIQEICSRDYIVKGTSAVDAAARLVSGFNNEAGEYSYVDDADVDLMREDWLEGGRVEVSVILKHGPGSADELLFCEELQAVSNVKLRDSLIAEVKELWSSGSVPRGCCGLHIKIEIDSIDEIR